MNLRKFLPILISVLSLFIILSQLSFAQEKKFVSLGLGGIPINELVVCDTDSNIMYAYSYNPYVSNYAHRHQIYKSSDSGENWSLMYKSALYTYCMDVNPNNPDTAYFGCNMGVFKTTDGGSYWMMEYVGPRMLQCYGIEVDRNNPSIIYGYGKYDSSAVSRLCFFKSSDGGTKWSVKHLKIATTDLTCSKNSWAVDRSTYQNLFIASHTNNESFLFKSTDSGETWSDLNISSGITSGNHIRCLTNDQNGSIFMCVDSAGIYKSSDLGETWEHCSSKPDNLQVLKIYEEGDSILFGSVSDTIHTSMDGGITWTPSQGKLSGGIIEAFVLHSPTDISVGNEFGVFRSTNAGETWIKKSSGMEVDINVRSFDVSQSNPGILYASFGNWFLYNLYKSSDTGRSWRKIPEIEGVHDISIDENNPDIIYILEGNRGFKKSTNGGFTWERLAPGYAWFFKRIRDSLWLCYYNTDTWFSFLKTSTDGGNNWTDLLIDLVESNPIAMDINPRNTDIIYYLGYCNGPAVVFKSTNGGTNWEIVYVHDSYGNSIRVDPSNPENIYMGTDGGIFKSTNSGQTWGTISSDSCFELYISKNGTIYAGGGQKIIISSDGGAHWEIYSEGLNSRVCRNCIKVDETNNIVYVGTDKQGVLSLDLNTTTSVGYSKIQPVKNYKLFNNYPNPFNQGTGIRFQVSGISDQGIGSSRIKLAVYNILGQHVRTLVDEEKPEGTYRIFWDGRDRNGHAVPSGVYFYRLQAGDFSEVKKMILLK